MPGHFDHDCESNCTRPHSDEVIAETSRAQRLFGLWLLSLITAAITLGFVWFAAKVIENL